MTASSYTPGTLLRARGRDWVVEADSTPELLHLRPLAGSVAESCWILPELELAEDAPRPSVFPPPEPSRRGNRNELNLLQSAMRMRLRSGAGPFRSFGNLSVQPRIYQLAPLLMALRQQVIRLLIADDVGIGKTIEAGLIVREMIDRGEVQRFSVLCPPNLAAQWKTELFRHFNINAQVVSSSSIARLERLVPPGQSVFEYFPYTIISLDYIKSPNHRDAFLNQAPKLIVVDEAHTCTSVTARNQQRYELLRTLADDSSRHMLLLTATPHSGIESGFYNLLGLLDKDFEQLGNVSQSRRNALRARLARHLIQRRRKDILRLWNEESVLPRRETLEQTYSLSGAWGDFFEEVRQYCVQEAQSAGNRMIWYAMLAMLRCVSSGPAAAASALRAKLNGEVVADAEEDCMRQFADASDQETPDDREAPAPELGRIRELLAKAESLLASGDDPKLKLLCTTLKGLLRDGYSPIVFCQYVSTAEYVAEALQKAFPKHAVKAVTGNLSPAEREESVEDLFREDKRILVATNCLSEGINLQNGFDAVVHYDLAWNPTRHEQREGRVDRFGQKAAKVRTIMIYGRDNPVDGFILNVILRKAITIRDELGVSVPVPADERETGEAMVHAVLLNNRQKAETLQQRQAVLPGFEEYAADMVWRDATERDKQRTTTFAQQSMQPEEVKPEYERICRLLGSPEELRSFLLDSCARLGAPLEEIPAEKEAYSLRVSNLPGTLSRRLLELGIAPQRKSNLYRFSLRPAGSELPCITRAHPLVSSIADYLAEQSLEENDTSAALPRCAVIRAQVPQLTTLYHLRLRHILAYSFGQSRRRMMAEELATLIRCGKEPLRFASPEEAERFAALPSCGNMSDTIAQALLSRALDTWKSCEIDSLLEERAQALQRDHTRVREASRIAAGSVQVSCCNPPDLLSVLVFQPAI